jgi:pimeloyl-ACP methyl ester carboxylesterase
MRRLLLLLACVAPGTAASAASAATTDSALTLARKTLTTASGVKLEADAGRLLVPENRAVSGSRPIAVGFLRLHSKAANPRAPLFYLEGGPGSRAVTENPRALEFWLPFLAVGDVVLIDQRGTNDSLLTWQWDGPPPLSYFAHEDSALRHIETMNRRARGVFRERGVDLAGYTTPESARDLDALRLALGYPKISLVGFSYGTHLGTAYIRYFGERVESAVLLGTEGPEQTYKLPWTMDVQFRKLALLAAADSGLAGKVPDLVALYDRVVERLRREPVIIPVAHPRLGTLPLRVGAFGLNYVLRVDLGDASDLVVVPRLLWSLDQGDTTVLAWFVRKRAGSGIGVHGMNQAMDVASGLSPARAALIAEQAKTSRFADVINFPHPKATDSWELPELPEEFRGPLVSAARVLFVSGEYDMNTPPFQAEELRWGLPHSTHLIVDHAGHEQTWFQNDSAIPVIVDFLKGMDVGERRITYPPLRFVPLEGSDPRVSHPAVPR